MVIMEFYSHIQKNLQNDLYNIALKSVKSIKEMLGTEVKKLKQKIYVHCPECYQDNYLPDVSA